jgi:hypothetical protein
MRNTRIPAKHIRNLEEALSFAKLERASFGFAAEKVTVHAQMGNPEETMSIDQFINDRTRIYRESWLIPAIQKVLDWANGKEPQV